jgi:hypothetical protein
MLLPLLLAAAYRRSTRAPSSANIPSSVMLSAAVRVLARAASIQMEEVAALSGSQMTGNRRVVYASSRGEDEAKGKVEEMSYEAGGLESRGNVWAGEVSTAASRSPGQDLRQTPLETITKPVSIPRRIPVVPLVPPIPEQAQEALSKAVNSSQAEVLELNGAADEGEPGSTQKMAFAQVGTRADASTSKGIDQSGTQAGVPLEPTSEYATAPSLSTSSSAPAPAYQEPTTASETKPELSSATTSEAINEASPEPHIFDSAPLSENLASSAATPTETETQETTVIEPSKMDTSSVPGGEKAIVEEDEDEVRITSPSWHNGRLNTDRF